MVQGPSHELIQTLRQPPSRDVQISSLKQLKNDVVGHEQRKELVVRHGVVAILVDIVSTPDHHHEARLQAILILGSLAAGGHAFVKPLLAAGTLDRLASTLNDRPDEKTTTASLQALRNFATSGDDGVAAIQEHLASPVASLVEMFRQVLQQSAIDTSTAKKQQLRLVCEIIALTSTNEHLRATLGGDSGGLIESLVSLLVSRTSQHTLTPVILSALSAIVTGSNYRVQCFILTPSMRRLYDTISETQSHDQPGAYNTLAASENTSVGSGQPAVLPQLHVPLYKTVSFNAGSNSFPALASLQNGSMTDYRSITSDHNHENAVVSWLVFLARSLQGMSRLHALRLLALVNNAIDADSSLSVSLGNRTGEAIQRARERERNVAYLAVPLAVKLIQAATDDKENPSSSSGDRENQDIREQACEVLALLIQGNKELQTNAVDAGAIKRVCPALKRTFDNVTVAKGMWSAHSSSEQSPELPKSCKMGSRGLPPEVRHVLRCRETALTALAALAKKEDLHRKAIIESGVVNCIIDSLTPLSTEFAAAVEAGGKKLPQHFKSADGNTTPVLLAACHAAQSLSRSVSLLRTSLIDAGIAKPIFTLLTHSNPEVQIAATDVACNLLLEFSPMRDDLLAAGAIKTLTEHARQNEMGLRLASLWALKHLVLNASKEVKVNVLEELGTGWLVGAIQGSSESRDAGGGVSITSHVSGVGGLSTANAAGQQVDLLNPPVSVSGSMDVDDDEDGVEEAEDEDEDGEVMYDEAADTHYQSSQLRSTLYTGASSSAQQRRSPHTSTFDSRRYLTSVRELEQNPALLAKRDDIAVQEQALDFIRNMLNGEDCAFMFEHLLRAMGQDKTFNLLADKLAPISPIKPGVRPLYQPTELVLSTVHVIVHIANAGPTHKQLLIAHPRLLSNWVAHFSHNDRRVRVICVWAVNSLTWVEDESDRQGAIQRSRALKDAGIQETIKGLREDSDLDVRERVRTAIRQFEAL